MNQLIQAASISIIGGADGPTAIYVGKEAFLQLFLSWLLLSGLALFFLVFFILKKRKLGIILSSVFCGIFLIPPALLFAGNLFMKTQNEKLNSQLKVATIPWSQEEITGYVFELDDSENDSEIGTVETFSFTGDSCENQEVMCTFGKKGKMLACPIKLWQIDEKGILCIFDDSPNERDCIKIQKIKIEEDILYALRDKQIVKYKYYKESAFPEEK